MTAFKTRPDALAMPIKFLFVPTLDNFYSVFWRADIQGGGTTDSGFSHYFFNILFIGGTSVSLALIMGTAAAYGFSRFPLRGNETYLFIILTTRMLPPIIAIIPIFVLFRVFGLSGSYTGIIALYTAFNLPFSIWMAKSFFDDLDRDIEDAARMDGSSEWRVFRKICLPQVYGGLAATFVFAVILTWNEFLFALMLTGTETRTVPVAIARTIGGQVGVDWGLMSAIETLFIIPVVIVTFLLQNQLLRGVTFGTIRK
jgi:multiple sugar transport system permease protein